MHKNKSAMYMENKCFSLRNCGDTNKPIYHVPQVSLYFCQTVTVGIKKTTTADDILQTVCSRRQLNPRDHYVRIKLPGTADGTYHFPEKNENIKKLVYYFFCSIFDIGSIIVFWSSGIKDLCCWHLKMEFRTWALGRM